MKKLSPSQIHYGHGARAGMDVPSLNASAKKKPEAFMRKMDGLIQEGKFTLNDFAGNIKRWWDATADVVVPVQMPDAVGTMRAITTSAFPIITGTLAIKAFNDKYDLIPTIGQDLVTDFDDAKKVTTIAAIHSLGKDKDEVKETEDFPEIGATEEKVEIRHKKNGRKITISAEMIREVDTVNIIEKLNALPEWAANWVEDLTLYRVTDHYGCASSPAAPYVYRPDGTGTTLYSATANTPGTRAPSGTRIESNALADETDLEKARIRLNAMLNASSRRINIPISQRAILVPDAVYPTLLKILNSEYVPGVENELSNWGPRGRFNIKQVISSPRLDDLSTSAWYYGDFKKQFMRKWKMRMEYVTLGQDTQAYLNAQIAFQARIALDVEVGARDYVFVVQNLSGTTAPYDE